MLETSLQIEITEWKRLYGKVFSVEYGDTTFIFRALSVKEYRAVQDSESNTSSVDVEEGLLRAALLYPVDIDFEEHPAGLASIVAESIMDVSGFGSPREAKAMLDEARDEAATDVVMLMKEFVLAVLPVYTEEQLEDLTFAQLVHKVALAEQIAEIHQSIMNGEKVSLALIDPAEEEERNREEAERYNRNRAPGQAVYGDPIAAKLKQAMFGG